MARLLFRRLPFIVLTLRPPSSSRMSQYSGPLLVANLSCSCSFGCKRSQGERAASESTPRRSSVLVSVKSMSVSSALALWYQNRHGMKPAEHYDVLETISHKSFQENKRQVVKDARFQTLCKEVVGTMEQLTANQIVQLLWSLACVHTNDKVTLEKIIHYLDEKPALVNCLTDKELGLMMWSLGTLRLKDSTEGLIDNVASEVMLRLQKDSFSNYRALANICWGMALLDQWPARLTDILMSYLSKKGDDLKKSRQLCIIAWSVHKANVPCDQWIIEAAGKSILRKGTDPVVVSQMFWMLGKANYYDEIFCKEVTEFVLSGKAWNWHKPRVLSQLVWYLSRVRYYDPLLMDYISDLLLPHVKQMGAIDTSEILYSFAFLNHPSSTLLHKSVKHIMELPKMESWTVKALWSCLVMDMYPQELFQLCFSDKFIEWSESYLYSHSIQVLQLDLASRVEHTHLSLPCLSFKNRAIFFKRMLDIKQQTDSVFHRNVINALKQLLGDSPLFLPEALSTTGYFMDAEILLDHNDRPVIPPVERREWSIEAIKVLSDETPPVDTEIMESIAGRNDSDNDRPHNLASDWSHSDGVSRKICVEADGPFHYAVNCRHALGRTVLKKRQMKAMGWEVLQIPYYEWEELGSCVAIDSQVEYLRNKIFSK